MQPSYWTKQEPGKPLFPEIEWNKPERRDLAGRLLIVGGHKTGFAAIGSMFNVAKSAGAGTVRVLFPDALKKALPPGVLEAEFLPSNISGGFSKESLNDMLQNALWADGILLGGDTGRNAETAMLMEALLSNTTQQLVITRDAVDLLATNSSLEMLNREQTTLVVSFAQLQKLLRTVHFPKVLLFSMHLVNVVEVIHKASLSYPATIVTFHQEQLIMAHDGKVITMPYGTPMSIWRGDVAAKAAAYLLWNSKKPLEAIATSVASS